MNLQNNTLIDKETYTDFQLFRKMHIKRLSFVDKLLYLLAGLIVLAFIVIAIFASNLYYVISAVIFGFLLYRELNSCVLKPKKMFEKNKISPVAVQYIFQSNSFYIPKDTDDTHQAIKYVQIVKLYDTPKHFYLFLSKNLAYIVSKDGFKDGDQEKFSHRLQEILGKSYKICK